VVDECQRSRAFVGLALDLAVLRGDRPLPAPYRIPRHDGRGDAPFPFFPDFPRRLPVGGGRRLGGGDEPGPGQEPGDDPEPEPGVEGPGRVMRGAEWVRQQQQGNLRLLPLCQAARKELTRQINDLRALIPGEAGKALPLPDDDGADDANDAAADDAADRMVDELADLRRRFGDVGGDDDGDDDGDVDRDGDDDDPFGMMMRGRGIRLGGRADAPQPGGRPRPDMPPFMPPGGEMPLPPFVRGDVLRRVMPEFLARLPPMPGVQRPPAPPRSLSDSQGGAPSGGISRNPVLDGHMQALGTQRLAVNHSIRELNHVGRPVGRRFRGMMGGNRGQDPFAPDDMTNDAVCEVRRTGFSPLQVEPCRDVRPALLPLAAVPASVRRPG
jgi:hypothetical protein